MKHQGKMEIYTGTSLAMSLQQAKVDFEVLKRTELEARHLLH